MQDRKDPPPNSRHGRPNMPKVVQELMYTVPRDMRKDDPDLRYPTPVEAMPRLKTAINALAERDGISYPVPALSTLKKAMIINKPPAKEGLDAPWTLGMSEYGNLPDDATGALLTMWKYVKMHGYTDPFTFRQAKWVNKLRWVPAAGGTPHGEVRNTHLMYAHTVRYAGRQLMAERLHEKKGQGMRSEYLEAQMMFTEAEYNLIKKLNRDFDSGLLDDSAINTLAESKLVAPQFTSFTTIIAGMVTGNAPYDAMSKSDFHEYLDDLLNSLSRFPQDFKGRDIELEAENLLAVIRLFTEEEGESLGIDLCIQAFLDLADSLFEAFRAGNMNHWDPPIQSIREKYLRDSN